MKASKQALDLIKEFEGFRSEPYKCPAGLLTVGYGDTDDASKGPVTRSQAEEMLQAEVDKFDKKLTEVVRYPLNQNQWDALVCFAYNARWNQFLQSRLLNELNSGNFPAALMHWKAWHNITVWDRVREKYVKKPSAGLIRRRNAEIELFKRPISNKLPGVVYNGSDNRTVREALDDQPPRGMFPLTSIVNWLRKQIGG